MSPSSKTVAVLMADSCPAKACIQQLLASEASGLKVRAIAESNSFRLDNVPAGNSLEIVTNIDPMSTSSLRNALAGIQLAVVFAPFDLNHKFDESATMSMNMLESVLGSGAGHLVYVNSLRSVNGHLESEGSTKITHQYSECEDLLRNQPGTKTHWTIIHCGCFMQNLPFLFERNQNAGVIKFPKVKARIVDLRDIGQFAASCITPDTQNPHYERVYQLDGAEQVDGESLARTMSQVLGIDVKLRVLSVEELDENLPPRMAKFFRFMIKSQQPTTESVPLPQDDQSQPSDVKFRTLREYILDHKDRF